MNDRHLERPGRRRRDAVRLGVLVVLGVGLAATTTACRTRAGGRFEVGPLALSVRHGEQGRISICAESVDGLRLAGPLCLGPLDKTPGPRSVLARLDDANGQRILLVVHPIGGAVIAERMERAVPAGLGAEVLVRVVRPDATERARSIETLVYRWSGGTARIDVGLSRRVVHPGEETRAAPRSPSSA